MRRMWRINEGPTDGKLVDRVSFRRSWNCGEQSINTEEMDRRLSAPMPVVAVTTAAAYKRTSMHLDKDGTFRAKKDYTPACPS